MKILPLIIVVYFLAGSCLKADQVLLSKSSKEVNGLVLKVELLTPPNASSSPIPYYIFKLYNNSNSVFSFNFSTLAFGFKLDGKSLDGKPISYSSAGSALFDQPSFGSHRGGEIPPGEFIEFKLTSDELVDLFSGPVQSVSVTWSRGVRDNGVYYPLIPGLKLDFDITKLTKPLKSP